MSTEMTTNVTKSDYLLYTGTTMIISVGALITFVCPMVNIKQHQALVAFILTWIVIGFIMQITSWSLRHVRFKQ